jgi:hypothetical protein
MEKIEVNLTDGAEEGQYKKKTAYSTKQMYKSLSHFENCKPLLHSWNKRLQRKFLKLLLENVFQGQIIKD